MVFSSTLAAALARPFQKLQKSMLVPSILLTDLSAKKLEIGQTQAIFLHKPHFFLDN